jgi:hypothetical protein
VRFVVFPPEERIVNLENMVHRVLSKGLVSLRQGMELLGLMESLSRLLPLGRVHKRPVQRWFLNRFPNQTLYDWTCLVDQELKDDLQIWLNRDWTSMSVPIRRLCPTIYCHTDASNLGWGAHMGDCQASGLWNKEETAFHINHKELIAVFRALVAFRQQMKGHWVTICGDNATALSYLRKQGGTRVVSLSLKAEMILKWCFQQGIRLEVSFVPGKLNVLADLLSRKGKIISTEWTVHHKFLQPIWDLWGRPHVDLFATHLNNRLPVFVSPFHDPRAWKKDAMSFHWMGLHAYAFPPFAMIPAVLEKWSVDRPRLILLAPFWPGRDWFAELKAAAHTLPRKLNLPPWGLTQPKSGKHNLQASRLDLTAWLLCEQNCCHEVSLADLSP